MLPSLTPDVVFNHVSDMMFIMSVDARQEFRYVKMNPAAMLGSGLNAYAYGATFQDVVESNEAGILYSQYLKVISLRRPVSFVLNHDGQIGESVLNPVIVPDGSCTHVVATVRDITERFQREAVLTQQASHDSLTGLLNRHGLRDRVQTAFSEARRQATLVSFLMIDADNLKHVNDTYGHIIGDLYLRDIAQRIHSAVRSEDVIARLGGDEFLVVAKVTDQTDVVVLAERILAAVAPPWPHDDIRLNMSISIGVAVYPVDGETPWEVVKAADKAMYEAKSKGGLRYEFAR